MGLIYTYYANNKLFTFARFYFLFAVFCKSQSVVHRHSRCWTFYVYLLWNKVFSENTKSKKGNRCLLHKYKNIFCFVSFPNFSEVNIAYFAQNQLYKLVMLVVYIYAYFVYFLHCFALLSSFTKYNYSIPCLIKRDQSIFLYHHLYFLLLPTNSKSKSSSYFFTCYTLREKAKGIFKDWKQFEEKVSKNPFYFFLQKYCSLSLQKLTQSRDENEVCAIKSMLCEMHNNNNKHV